MAHVAQFARALYSEKWLFERTIFLENYQAILYSEMGCIPATRPGSRAPSGAIIHLRATEWNMAESGGAVYAPSTDGEAYEQ